MCASVIDPDATAGSGWAPRSRVSKDADTTCLMLVHSTRGVFLGRVPYCTDPRRRIGHIPDKGGSAVKFIHLFLVGYFVLVVGVVLALWQTGVLSRVSPIWIAIGVIVAAGVGIMMAVSSGKPEVTKEG